MSRNLVKAFMITGTIFKNSKAIILGIATQTSLFNRPEATITEAMKARFRAAVIAHPQPLPANVKKILMRETEHGQDQHVTAALLDDYGNHVDTWHLLGPG